MQVSMTVNGEPVTREIEGRMLLVHFLRDELGLTGTHWGCDTSNCGTCVGLARRRAGEDVHGARRDGRRARRPHRRGARGGRRARPGPGGLHAVPRPAVRVLHARHADDRARPARPGPRPRASRPSARRSPARSAGAPATPPSCARCSGPRRMPAARSRRTDSRTRDRGEPVMTPSKTRGPRARRQRPEAMRPRPDAAQGGPALHPRPRQLRRRRPAARHAAPGHPALARGARPDRSASTPPPRRHIRR